MPWVAAEAWVGDIQADGSGGKGAPGSAGRAGRIGVPSRVGLRRRSLFRLGAARQRLVEPLSRARRRDRAAGADGGGVSGRRIGISRCMSTYAFDSAERIVMLLRPGRGVWRLARLDLGTKHFDPMALPFTSLSQLRARRGTGRVPGRFAHPEATALVDARPSPPGRTHRVIRRSAVLGDDLRPYISVARPIAFPTEGGETAARACTTHHSRPASQRRPERRRRVLVKSHGGPTASSASRHAVAGGVQYWDQPAAAIGVLDVNYRGSTGYGRPYRLRLARQWGILDVQDCVHGRAAIWVEAEGADPGRLMISGGRQAPAATRRSLRPDAGAGEEDF